MNRPEDSVDDFSVRCAFERDKVPGSALDKLECFDDKFRRYLAKLGIK